MVKFELVKRDFVWIGLIVVLIGIGFVYAYGGDDASVMGHSSGEIVVDNALCNQIMGNNCGVSGSSGNVAGDLILGGSNSWILHTPDDGRTNLYFSSYPTDWSEYITFKEGSIGATGNICTASKCLSDSSIDNNDQSWYAVGSSGRTACPNGYVVTGLQMFGDGDNKVRQMRCTRIK